jgi:hypothetical protein
MDERSNSTTTAAGSSLLARGIALLRSLGPYAALELVLPGGSLLALLLWLYRHRCGSPRAPLPLIQGQHISCC